MVHISLCVQKVELILNNSKSKPPARIEGETSVYKITTSLRCTQIDLITRLIFYQDMNDDSSIILQGSRIVIPSALRQQAMDIAHEGHQDEAIAMRKDMIPRY